MAEESNNSLILIPDLNLEPVDDSTETQASFEHGEGSGLNKLENDEISGKKVDNNDDGESFFCCPICLDLAKDPVVTPCGHLFCWACLYRWINGRRDDDMECPVCKGAVDLGYVTPIYGRGTNPTREPVTSPIPDDIPVRPHARRVESWRRHFSRAAITSTVEDRMIGQFGMDPESVRSMAQDSDGWEGMRNLLVHRVLTSSALRGDNVDLTDGEDPPYDDDDEVMDNLDDQGRLASTDPDDRYIIMDNEVVMTVREAYDFSSTHVADERSANQTVGGGNQRSGSDNVDVGNAVGSIIDISAIFSRFNNN